MFVIRITMAWFRNLETMLFWSRCPIVMRLLSSFTCEFSRMLDAATILRCRQRLEEHKLVLLH